MLSSFTFFLERIGPSHKKFWELRNFKIYGKIIRFHTFFEKVKVVLFLIRTSFSLETYIIRYAFSTFIICRSPSDLLSKIKNRLHSGVIIHSTNSHRSNRRLHLDLSADLLCLENTFALSQLRFDS